MSDRNIGIKLANGQFYPILEDGKPARKRLVVTTVKDDQPSVQIDMYRGAGETAASAAYIGSLVIENIPPRPKGEPDIRLELALDEDGELVASAQEEASGESQSLRVPCRPSRRKRPTRSRTSSSRRRPGKPPPQTNCRTWNPRSSRFPSRKARRPPRRTREFPNSATPAWGRTFFRKAGRNPPRKAENPTSGSPKNPSRSRRNPSKKVPSGNPPRTIPSRRRPRRNPERSPIPSRTRKTFRSPSRSPNGKRNPASSSGSS